MGTWTPPNAKYPPPKPGEPPLHRATRLGDADEIRRLLREEADIDAQFDIGLDPGAYAQPATPLMVAAGSGDGATVETVQLLLDLGADPRVRAKGSSAATFAAQGLGWNYRPGGDARRLQVVLDAGSPLPEAPEASNRLLCRTAETGDALRLGLLLARGLNPRGFWDPERARSRHQAVTERMARGRDEADVLALLPREKHEAYSKIRKELQERQLEMLCSGPSPFDIPLHRAAASGSAECIGALVAAGADPLTRDNFAQTAMYHAASSPAVQALMAAGVPLEGADTQGKSPLMHAVSSGGRSSIARIKALIEAGANVNGTSSHGMTVFLSAVGFGRIPEALPLLIEAGADPHAVTEHGHNAFHAAICIIGAETRTTVRETFTYIKRIGVDIEHRDTIGQTPLAQAIERGRADEVCVLCELGANPNVVCPKHQCGTTGCGRIDLPLLFHASDGIGGERDIKTEALLRAGADPLVKDSEGYTPLERLVAELCRGSPGHVEAYAAFFNGLDKLQVASTLATQTRAGFVAEATAPLRTYVERLAGSRRPEQASEFAAKLRAEQTSCAVLLCAYELWARRRTGG